MPPEELETPTTETPTETPTVGTEETTTDSSGINPAWNDLLGALPSSLHSQVTPHLRKWDDNFRQVQSQLEPYKEFADVPREELQAAVQLFRLANSNPELIYREMGEYYGFNSSGQGQQEEAQQNSGEELDLNSVPDDFLQHPKMQEMMRAQQDMAQIIVGQHQAAENERLSQQLDAEMADIVGKNAALNNDGAKVMIYNIAAANRITLTQAAEQLSSFMSSNAIAAPSAPSVLGGNGSLPATSDIDPTKLDGKGTRNLVAEILASNRNQG